MTMQMWRGRMNWPIDKETKCQTCGARFVESGMTWGLAHGIARCNQCHTQYALRDANDKRVEVPICRLKDEYKDYARVGWSMYHSAINTWHDKMWEATIDRVEGENND